MAHQHFVQRSFAPYAFFSLGFGPFFVILERMVSPRNYKSLLLKIFGRPWPWLQHRLSAQKLVTHRLNANGNVGMARINNICKRNGILTVS